MRHWNSGRAAKVIFLPVLALVRRLTTQAVGWALIMRCTSAAMLIGGVSLPPYIGLGI